MTLRRGWARRWSYLCQLARLGVATQLWYAPLSLPSPDLAPHLDERGDDSTDADEGGMDTIQQIKNARMNAEANARGRAKGAGSSNMTVQQHAAALQAMSNGHAVPYPASLRVVVHEGDRAPQGEAKEEKKAPGFVRNESGGFFTS
jgi:hypothetical protein